MWSVWSAVQKPSSSSIFIFIVSIVFSVTIVVGIQSGSKCVIRVVGGETPSNNVFFVKRIIKISLPLIFLHIFLYIVLYIFLYIPQNNFLYICLYCTFTHFPLHSSTHFPKHFSTHFSLHISTHFPLYICTHFSLHNFLNFFFTLFFITFFTSSYTFFFAS